MEFVCLFELMFYAPVNSNGHVGTLPPFLWDFYPILGCHDTQNVLHKGPLTIWPVYAYTLAAQNTVIKLLMLILSVENNTSMSCEAIYAKIFVYFVII